MDRGLRWPAHHPPSHLGVAVVIHPHTELRPADARVGYGVFATHLIPRGTITWVHDFLDQTFSPDDVARLAPLHREALERYAYIEPTGAYVLCWDHARYNNHACRPSGTGHRGLYLATSSRKCRENGTQCACAVHTYLTAPAGRRCHNSSRFAAASRVSSEKPRFAGAKPRRRE